MKQDTDRLERLNLALAELRRINGSPDLIAAVLRAIEQETTKK